MENSISTEEVAFSIDGHVATVELRRPPNNFLDIDLIASLASVLEQLDEDADVRAFVLAAEGKHFCAGANLIKRVDDQASGKPPPKQTRHLYHEAQRLIATRKAIVAGLQRSGVGGGGGTASLAR